MVHNEGGQQSNIQVIRPEIIVEDPASHVKHVSKNDTNRIVVNWKDWLSSLKLRISPCSQEKRRDVWTEGPFSGVKITIHPSKDIL